MESFFILKNISKPKKIIAARNGFSFYSFTLGPIWGIFMGLWTEGFSGILLVFLMVYLAPELSYFFILTSSFFWGIFGKDIYIQKLLKLDYIAEDIVISNSSQKAILIFSSKKR